MFGLGKKRSRFGSFIDSHGIKQEKIRDITKVSRETMWKACNDDDYKPRPSIRESLTSAVKKLTGKNLDSNDFWM